VIGYKFADANFLKDAYIIVGNWSLTGECKQGRKGNIVREAVEKTPIDIAVDLLSSGQVAEGRKLLADYIDTQKQNEPKPSVVAIDSSNGWD